MAVMTQATDLIFFLLAQMDCSGVSVKVICGGKLPSYIPVGSQRWLVLDEALDAWVGQKH